MKKLQILVLALLAVSALSAVIVTSASAETTLLALWLVGGNTFVGELLVETEGEILLEDTKFGIAVVCSGILDGFVNGTNGEDLITEVLNLAGEKTGVPLSGLPILCTTEKGCMNETDIEVWPLNLPWETLLELLVLTGGVEDFYDLILKGTGGLAGYEVLCLVLLTVTSESCESPEGSGGEVKNVAGGVEAAEEEFLPLANCTTGGTEVGANEPLSGNTTLVSGGTLEVSE
jgi:hypothetical protein